MMKTWSKMILAIALGVAFVSCEKEELTENFEQENQTENLRIKEVSDGDDEAHDGDDSELNVSRTLKSTNLAIVLIAVSVDGQIDTSTEVLDDLIVAHFDVSATTAEGIRNDLIDGFAIGEFEHLGCPIAEVESDVEDELQFVWL